MVVGSLNDSAATPAGQAARGYGVSTLDGDVLSACSFLVNCLACNVLPHSCSLECGMCDPSDWRTKPSGSLDPHRSAHDSAHSPLTG